jgi:hypothetical protein
VCRSIYAGALVFSALNPLGVQVNTAGLAPLLGQPACDRVRERCALAGIPLLAGGSRRCTLADLTSADFILVMTRQHEGAVSRLLPEARGRTFPLARAAILARFVASQEAPVSTFGEWVAQLSSARGSVPMPAPQPVLRRMWRKDRREVRSPIDIPDRHNSRSTHEHESALDLVAEYTGSLLGAWKASFGIEG